MYVRLNLLTEPNQDRTLDLRAGSSVQVGRLKTECALAVPDRFLAPAHFTLHSTETGCTLKDVSRGARLHARCARRCFLEELRNARCSKGVCGVHDMSGDNGVYVNGKQVSECTLADGDVIVAGTTGFLVQLSVTPHPPAPQTARAPTAPSQPKLTPQQQRNALAQLTQLPLRSYAVLDAARDPRVLALLRSHAELYYSLYDGAEGEKLAEVAPYLVELAAGSPLTQLLVSEHWGQCFGTFLFSPEDFKSVRRHLRRFLLVDDEQKKKMYFRFYDPRVLRAFLPTCNPGECAEFFGPITHFLTEAEVPDRAWLFSRNAAGMHREAVRF